jgi:type IV pilus assembly protein PilM
MNKSLFNKKQPSLIGVDIGTSYIKAVVISNNKDGYCLESYACEAIGKDAFNEREIKDFDAIGLTLKKVKLALKSKLKDCVIAVSGPSVLSKIVYMDPDQSDFELEGQIEIEADSLIPYPLEEVYLDFEELGESKTHSGKVNVLLSAAHKDIVDSRILLVREIDFEPKAVDIESYALGNALAYFHADTATDAPICCIHIGASLLQVCVYQHGEVIYTKEHAFGMNMLIQDLAVIHMLDHHEVVKQLVENRLPPNWETDTLPIFTANLQQQINRALQMYMSTLHVERPERLVLSGAGATIAPLVETLQQDLALTIETFNPFANMTINDKINQEQLQKIAPLLAIASGLASRSFTPWHI